MKVLRFITKATILLGLLLVAITPIMAAIQVDLNGNPMNFSVQPMQINGRTMVPLRGIFEALGAQVNWNADTRTIVADKGNTEVKLTIGDPHATVNGQTVLLDTPATIIQGATTVPLRFISESMGADVKWFEATQTVSITTSTESAAAPPPPAYQQPVEPSYTSEPAPETQVQSSRFSSDELDVLLGPIALYPDPLIAQILPASTFPDQLVDADDLVRNTGTRDIDQQNWDVSVKAIAYYPSVLSMMVEKPDWTTSIGQAYEDQPDGVLRSIQRLREIARSLGYLTSNDQQRVYNDSGNIRIVPVQTRYIYVPQYDPQVVYTQRRRPDTSNALNFGLGLLIGSWLNRDVDYNHNKVYYHGWNGGGWVGNSKPSVRTNDSHYVNNDYRDKPIAVDHNVKSRDVGSFRNEVKRNIGTFKLPESRQPNRSNTHSGQNGKDNGQTQNNTQGHGDSHSQDNTQGHGDSHSQDNQQGR